MTFKIDRKSGTDVYVLNCLEEVIDIKRIIYSSIIKTGFLSFSFMDINGDNMIFSAESVDSLANFKISLSYVECIRLIDCLTKQIQEMRVLGYGLYGLDINDIVVIDSDIFFICATDKLVLLDKEKELLYFDSPFSKPFFSSPEILRLNMLPTYVSYKVIYYSLGALVVYCLLNNNILKGNDILNASEIDLILKPIKHTKLYWFLKRCFHEDCNKRLWLFV